MEETPHPQGIDGRQQAPPRGVPDHEREIPRQAPEEGFPQLQAAAQGQIGIVQSGGLGGPHPQAGQDGRSLVQAHPPHQGRAAPTDHPWRLTALVWLRPLAQIQKGSRANPYPAPRLGTQPAGKSCARKIKKDYKTHEK